MATQRCLMLSEMLEEEEEMKEEDRAPPFSERARLWLKGGASLKIIMIFHFQSWRSRASLRTAQARLSSACCASAVHRFLSPPVSEGSRNQNCSQAERRGPNFKVPSDRKIHRNKERCSITLPTHSLSLLIWRGGKIPQSTGAAKHHHISFIFTSFLPVY